MVFILIILSDIKKSFFPCLLTSFNCFWKYLNLPYKTLRIMNLNLILNMLLKNFLLLHLKIQVDRQSYIQNHLF